MYIFTIVSFTILAMIPIDLLAVVKMYRVRRFRNGCFELFLHLILAAEICLFYVAGREPDRNGFIMALDHVSMTSVICAVYPFVCIVYGISHLIIEYRIRKTTITASSVSEGIAKMDCGLLFCEKDGTLVLTNRKMRDIYREIFGRNFTNGKVLWQTVSEKMTTPNAIRILFTGDPTFRLNSGTVICFSKNALTEKRRKYDEIIARDITDIYNKTAELKENNRRLEETEKRLQETYRNIAQLKQEEELLTYKMQIHDELGNSILSGQALLNGETIDDVSKTKLLEDWEKTLRDLRSNLQAGGVTGNNSLDDLRNTAQRLGTKLLIKGTLPNDNIIVMAIREALYNAVKHSEADMVMVVSTKDEKGYNIVISDNGVKKTAENKEGGGLTNIRRNIENSGGSFEVEWGESVILKITLPLEEKQ